MSNTANNNTDRKPPVHVEKCRGTEAAIWERETEDGTTHYVTLSRSYMQQGQWKRTATFFRDDLPVLRALLERAYAWLLFQEEAE